MMKFMKKQKKVLMKKVTKYLDKFSGCKKFCLKNWKKAVVTLGLIGLLVYFKSMIVVAWVNNQPIFRYNLIRELEAQGGQQVLDTLITKEMILQTAKKRGVGVSQEEVETEMVKIEEIAQQQGMSLDELLELQDIKRSDLIKQIKIQQVVEKLAGEGVEVSDEEAKVYLEENKDFLPENSTEEELMKTTKNQLKQQKLNTKIQEMIGQLKDEAKVVSWF